MTGDTANRQPFSAGTIAELKTPCKTTFTLQMPKDAKQKSDRANANLN